MRPMRILSWAAAALTTNTSAAAAANLHTIARMIEFLPNTSVVPLLVLQSSKESIVAAALPDCLGCPQAALSRQHLKSGVGYEGDHRRRRHRRAHHGPHAACARNRLRDFRTSRHR